MSFPVGQTWEEQILENTLYITFFGRFTLSRTRRGESCAAAEPGRASRRLWTFLQYLCAFHQKGASQEEIIEAVWEDGEVANPAGALKTILHRARTLLEGLGFPDGKKILLYRHGRYSWSPDVEFHMDTEELDRLYAAFATSPQDALPGVLEFLPRYEGDFLSGVDEGSWALSLRTFYHTRYLHLSWAAADLLRTLGRFDEAIGICRAATTLDPYDERCQLLLIRLLHISGTTQTAMKHYSTVSELYMNQLGVSPSPEMQALFRDISKAGGAEDLNLHVLREELREAPPVKGPFFCEYAVFQDIYRLMTRRLRRFPNTAQLVLLTITGRGVLPLDAQQRAAAMEALQEAGLSVLRPGDVAARVGPTQVLLLLPDTSQENAQTALQRVLDAFAGTLIGKRAAIQVNLLPAMSAVGAVRSDQRR